MLRSRETADLCSTEHVWANDLLEFLLENSPGPLPDGT